MGSFHCSRGSAGTLDPTDSCRFGSRSQAVRIAAFTDRDRQRQTERQTATDRDRQRQTETDRDRQNCFVDHVPADFVQDDASFRSALDLWS